MSANSCRIVGDILSQNVINNCSGLLLGPSVRVDQVSTSMIRQSVNSQASLGKCIGPAYSKVTERNMRPSIIRDFVDDTNLRPFHQPLSSVNTFRFLLRSFY